MREILFRGKRIDNGEWVEGYYHRFTGATKMLIDRGWDGHPNKYEDMDIDHHLITVSKMPDYMGWDYNECIMHHKVDPDTVGQYLKSYNLYEGDTVELNSSIPYDNGNSFWDEGLEDEMGTVCFNGDSYIIKTDSGEHIPFYHLEEFEIDLEVTGNIHENENK